MATTKNFATRLIEKSRNFCGKMVKTCSAKLLSDCQNSHVYCDFIEPAGNSNTGGLS